MRGSRRTPSALLHGALALTLGCGTGPKDAAAPAGEAAPEAAPARAPEPEGYVYVARRGRSVVALAEARNIDDPDARRMVDELADRLEACARGLEAEGALVQGAARVVAEARTGEPTALNVKLAPGEAVAQNALLCLIAPIRALPFPPAQEKARAPALAIEATWEPASHRAATSGDAGG